MHYGTAQTATAATKLNYTSPLRCPAALLLLLLVLLLVLVLRSWAVSLVAGQGRAASSNSGPVKLRLNLTEKCRFDGKVSVKFDRIPVLATAPPVLVAGLDALVGSDKHKASTANLAAVHVRACHVTFRFTGQDKGSCQM